MYASLPPFAPMMVGQCCVKFLSSALCVCVLCLRRPLCLRLLFLVCAGMWGLAAGDPPRQVVENPQFAKDAKSPLQHSEDELDDAVLLSLLKHAYSMYTVRAVTSGEVTFCMLCACACACTSTLCSVNRGVPCLPTRLPCSHLSASCTFFGGCCCCVFGLVFVFMYL
jgi:hypothetical protein